MTEQSESQEPPEAPVGDGPGALAPDAPATPPDPSMPTVVDQPSPVADVVPAVETVVAPPEPPPAIAGPAAEPPAPIPPATVAPPTVPPVPVPPVSASAPWTPEAESSSSPSGPAAIVAERPEVAVGAAFAGGLVLALILKRLAR